VRRFSPSRRAPACSRPPPGRGRDGRPDGAATAARTGPRRPPGRGRDGRPDGAATAARTGPRRPPGRGRDGRPEGAATAARTGPRGPDGWRACAIRPRALGLSTASEPDSGGEFGPDTPAPSPQYPGAGSDDGAEFS